MNIRELSAKAQGEVLSIVGEMKAGKRDHGIEWGDDVQNGKVAIQEMIGTGDGAQDFLEKTTYDAYQGREAVELLYKDIYSTREDATFPKVMTAKEYGPIQVVFVEKFEGGEVKFGELGPGVEKVVRFHTYAAGLEWSEDMVEYNEFWSLTDASISFGENYNKLLNHLHLSPIITASYATTGGGTQAQADAQKDGTAQLVAFDTDIPTTLETAFTVMPRGSILLHNDIDAIYLERQIAADILDDGTPGPIKRRFGTLKLLTYAGEEVQVGDRTYTYGGVPAGFAFLITPKKNFVEYIKHDLRLDSGNADVSRLIVDQMVGRARRAVFAAVGGKDGAIKIDLRT
jgi:hypothetical protein